MVRGTLAPFLLGVSCLFLTSACLFEESSPTEAIGMQIEASDPTATRAMTSTTTANQPAPSPTVVATPESTPEPAPEPRRISLPPQEVSRGNRDRREMSLTFDCGASGQPTPAILDALKIEGVRTTFFLTGQWVRQNVELSRRIAAEHEVANHSVSHPDFATLTNAQIRDEMQRANRIILDTTGVETRPFWRAPFGSRDRRILTTVAEAGWIYHIYWSADSGDWREITPQQVRANINAAAQNGAIIVQHCGSTQSAVVIGEVISDLKAKGFTLTTVSDLLRD